jgi:hypothetical protein
MIGLFLIVSRDTKFVFRVNGPLTGIFGFFRSGREISAGAGRRSSGQSTVLLFLLFFINFYNIGYFQKLLKRVFSQKNDQPVIRQAIASCERKMGCTYIQYFLHGIPCCTIFVIQFLWKHLERIFRNFFPRGKSNSAKNLSEFLGKR